MKQFHNIKRLKKTRRSLRRRETKPEILLWSKLRNNKTGYKYKRQHSLGPYIADFYCAHVHLVVEVDGPIHFTDAGHLRDKKRDQFLRDHGFNVIHFSTIKVMDDIETVVVEIKIACNALSLERNSLPDGEAKPPLARPSPS